MIFLSLVFIAFTSQSMEKNELIFSNGKKLIVELAQNTEQRSQGLMNRTELAKNSGMLFIFPGPQPLSFWMKDTYIPLSIAYFDSSKKLKEIYDLTPQNMMERSQDLRSYPSKCLCQYALEVNQGWFTANKVKLGMTFELKELSKVSKPAQSPTQKNQPAN